MFMQLEYHKIMGVDIISNHLEEPSNHLQYPSNHKAMCLNTTEKTLAII